MTEPSPTLVLPERPAPALSNRPTPDGSARRGDMTSSDADQRPSLQKKVFAPNVVIPIVVVLLLLRRRRRRRRNRD